MESKINIFPNKDILNRESAKYIAGLMDDIIKEEGKCTFVLAGGSTPKGLYEKLASEPYKSKIEWNNVHLFWGDERCVPPEHEESNYRMAKEAMIDYIPIPEENVHRMPAEKEPADAAHEYGNTLKEFFGGGKHLPKFDILLLGIGDDGHTASLFPGTTALEENKRWVAELFVSKLDTHRITMTFPVINNARYVIFLVTGKSKKEVVERLITGEDAPYPVSRVKPEDGKLVFLLDREAGPDMKAK